MLFERLNTFSLNLARSLLINYVFREMAEIERKFSNVPLKHAHLLKGPSQLAFDITNRCNFRCIHCFNRSGENEIIKNELTDDEVISFIRDLAELKPLNLCFCGGEPLLREELIYECAKILISYGSEVSLVTNGYLLNKEKAKKLADIGIKNIQVSLDGARPESHEKLRGVKGSFERAVNAIKLLLEEGVKPGVAFSPTKFNADEFIEVYALCKEIGVKDLRVQPLMILGRAQLNIEELVPTPFQYRKLVKIIYELQVKENDMVLEWGDPVDHLIRFRSLCQHCVNYVDIRADGGIVASPYIPLVIGNIQKHKFSEYWDAGLARMWELPIVKNLAKKICSVSDFANQSVYFEKDIEIDIVDDNLIEPEVMNE